MPLRQLYPDPNAESKACNAARVDIIAVHGLNPRSKNDRDHAWDTWRKPSGPEGRLWLRDELPQHVPEARIFLYEYNSTAVYGKDRDTFIGKANEMLEAIRIERRGMESRPILFLGHSMGGLLIKQALINAHNNPKYTTIKEATTGLAFFATPHHGGDWMLVSLGGVVAKIAMAVGFQKGDDVLETLKNGSIFSEIMKEHWRHQLLKYDIISFWGALDKIVSEESAQFGMPGDRENVVKLNADHSGVCKYGSSLEDQDNFKLVRSNLEDLYENALKTYHHTQQHLSDPEDRNCLQDLRTTDPRVDKRRIEETKGGLLRDSYRWILENSEFRRWHDDKQSQLLWIRGDPGKGKTMLLCGIIDKLEETSTSAASASGSCLLSYFFCQATDSRINNAKAVLRGLIYLLADQQPALLQHVRKKYDSAGKELFVDMNAWFALSEIFINILRDPSLGRIYVIIDALDECVEGLPELLEFIVQYLSVSSRIKLIISSRNWPDIEEQLNAATQKVILLLELNEDSISDAVDIYTYYKVNRLALDKKYDNRTRDAVQQYLSLNSDNTFLWVALVCQNLKQVKRWNVLDKLKEFPPGLEALYQRMVDQIDDSEDAETCRQIIAVVSTVLRPITLAELTSYIPKLEDLSDDYEALIDVVGNCCSFLTLRERTISFIHQSAKDFLVEKAFGKFFPTGSEACHYMIFSRSLQVLSKTLRRDIYSLRAPGITIDQVKQPDPDPLAAVRYSCLYWVDHLLECETRKDTIKDLKDSGSVCGFLRQYFLYWLEALSLLKSVSEGVVMIRKLEHLQFDESSTLYAFIHDARRFALYNRSIIEQAPLQAYCSALVFAPEESIVRETFERCVPSWIQRKSRVETYWNAMLQTLEGHTREVSSVAFSPDGKQIVSGSWDNTVRLWDTATGKLVRPALEGHTSGVRSVAFSPNGKQIVSGSYDRTVRRWDIATGQQLLPALEGHTSRISSVAFSPDSKQIVSGSWDKTIRCWDTATGQQLLPALEGHTDRVTSVAFSPNGKQIVSGSYDKIVRLWDAATGLQLPPALEGHISEVTSVAFSLDGKQIVSGSWDNTVRLWDIVTGQLILPALEGHTSGVTSVAFSADGKQIVSGSSDKTVRRWDMATGQQLLPVLDGGHTNGITSVAFSPDSKQIVSGSWDKTIRCWDAATGQPLLLALEGHKGRVTSVAFSPDGKHIVSGSYDKTVRRWDAATGLQLSPALEGHISEVTSVAFSPDGKQIVSGSSDRTVRRWDAATGQQLLPALEGHISEVTSVAFSPDGKQIVSGSYDKTVRRWDAATGQQLLPALEGHISEVTSVAFSPDSKQIVSRSSDKTIRCWDAATGQQLLPALEGHIDGITSVAFSPDSKHIVSGCWDKTIRRWDAATGQLLLPALEGHTNWVTSVAFSPDGKQIVSGSYDKTVRRWDAATGQQLLPALEGHISEFTSVAFSPNSKQIVSGSCDKTVRRWDAATGQQLLPALEGHTGGVTSVAFSADGKQIVSGSYDKTVRLWDAATGLQLSPALEGHISEVTSVAFSPDGKQIVSGSWDKTVRLWDAATGQQLLPALQGHANWVISVAFSPNGKQIVSGSSDRTVRRWDAATGQQLLPALEGYTDRVTSVAFSPDGKQIVSGSWDKSVRCWDAATGQPLLLALEGRKGRVTSVAFSPDGKRISTLHVSGEWLVEDTARFLWLPTNYRPTCEAAWGMVVALGHASGRLSFLQIQQGLKQVTEKVMLVSESS